MQASSCCVCLHHLSQRVDHIWDVLVNMIHMEPYLEIKKADGHAVYELCRFFGLD